MRVSIDNMKMCAYLWFINHEKINTMKKQYYITPDPLFIDPITGDRGKYTIATKPFMGEHKGVFNTWAEAWSALCLMRG